MQRNDTNLETNWNNSGKNLEYAKMVDWKSKEK